MENTYNLKIKEYKEQTVVSVYHQPIIMREKLDNVIIQLKKYRTQNAELWIDNCDGTGVYNCNSVYLDAEIKMALFDEDLEDYYNYVCLRVNPTYTTTIKNDFEKEERSLKTSLSRTKQKVYDIAYCNDWDMFITLTFDDNELKNKYNDCAWNYEICTKALHSFFTILKRNYKDIQYLGVPELHHSFYNTTTGDIVIYNNKDFKDCDYETLLNKQNRTQQEQDLINNVINGTYKRRFHFHFLFNNFPKSQLIDSGKKTKSGDVIYNLLNYKLGFTTCTLIKSLQASQHYITKYISKDLISVSSGKKRYWASRNLNKPIENNYYIDLDEKQELQQELVNSIESDTRVKKIEIENDGFNNVIYKYVIKDWEVYQNKVLEDYIDINNKIYIYEVPDYFNNVEEYMNMNSIFNPILHNDGYVKHRGITFKYNKINGIYKISAI